MRFQPLLFLTVTLTTTCATTAVVWSDAQDQTACVSEIQTVCSGLEDHLETCLQQRGQTLSQTCRDQLDSALSISRNGAGPDPCVDDIKNACGNLDTKELANCVASKKDSFSKACQDYIAGVAATAKGASASN